VVENGDLGRTAWYRTEAERGTAGLYMTIMPLYLPVYIVVDPSFAYHVCTQTDVLICLGRTQVGAKSFWTSWRHKQRFFVVVEAFIDWGAKRPGYPMGNVVEPYGSYPRYKVPEFPPSAGVSLVRHRFGGAGSALHVVI